MASWLTIVLPGAGYGPLGAVLRLPVLALEAAGATTATVTYPPRTATEEPIWWATLHEAVADQVGSAIAHAQPSRVTFVAKSLGTVALAALDASGLVEMGVDAIWLTPLFGQPEVRRGAVERHWRSLLVAGGADSYHHAEGHEEVRQALGAWSLVLDGADHALEVEGNPLATVEHLRCLTAAVINFSHLRPITRRHHRSLRTAVTRRQLL